MDVYYVTYYLKFEELPEIHLLSCVGDITDSTHQTGKKTSRKKDNENSLFDTRGRRSRVEQRGGGVGEDSLTEIS